MLAKQQGFVRLFFCLFVYGCVLCTDDFRSGRGSIHRERVFYVTAAIAVIINIVAIIDKTPVLVNGLFQAA